MREFFGRSVDGIGSLKGAAIGRVYEEECCASDLCPLQNGTTLSIGLASDKRYSTANATAKRWLMPSIQSSITSISP